MSEEKLTEKQARFLECFKTLSDANGLYNPSLREVQKALGLKSVSTAASHADGLIAKGYMRKEGNTARSLRLVDRDTESVSSKKEELITLLGEEINKRNTNPKLAEEVKILEAALQLLDQTEEK